MPTTPEVRLCRPGEQPPAGALTGQIVVLDLAFSGKNPRRDLAWANSLGSRLIAWVDHHDQELWSELENDDRFCLTPREQAPACPPLVTPELVAERGPASTIVCHGDLDGVLSAAKWWILQDGGTVPKWLDPDSIVADSRRGTFTARGEFFDHALRGGNDAVRRLIVRAVYAEAMGRELHPNDQAKLERAVDSHHSAVKNSLEQLVRTVDLNDIPESAVYLDLHPCGGSIDLTEILLALQRDYDWVVLRARAKGHTTKWVVGTNPERSGLDLRREFKLQGFAPFRVHVELEVLLERLPTKLLPQNA